MGLLYYNYLTSNGRIKKNLITISLLISK